MNLSSCGEDESGLLWNGPGAPPLADGLRRGGVLALRSVTAGTLVPSTDNFVFLRACHGALPRSVKKTLPYAARRNLVPGKHSDLLHAGRSGYRYSCSLLNLGLQASPNQAPRGASGRMNFHEPVSSPNNGGGRRSRDRVPGEGKVRMRRRGGLGPPGARRAGA
jgi:hypothetical protein